MPSQVHKHTLLREIISRYGVKPECHKLHALTEMPPQEKGNTWGTKVSEQILNSNNRSMQATVVTDVSKADLT